ncbi:MAG: nucleotidyl transferase AbiEii/AbiGii toxin family protein [Proteobacteria bacterium]|nr:nucleotidyl transferase AbiEii/AbiGii toxin family protein [Pseudomonadota bacterium]
MKEEALALVANIDDPVRKLNILREYVQAFVLRSLHEIEAFTSIAFVGGTALRFLFNVPRFSEDLDFSVISNDAYEPKRWLKKAKRELELAGFNVTIKWKEKNTVNMAWVRIGRLLHPAGLASRAAQNLSIKLDIDTRPPEGAEVLRAVIDRHLTFAVSHHSSGSLLAGKMHALVTRPYPKGRDWFDLLWFSARRPPVQPNLTLLQNALNQTRGKKFSAKKWPAYLKKKLDGLDVDELSKDVSSFLERPQDRLLLTRENLEAALRAFI